MGASGGQRNSQLPNPLVASSGFNSPYQTWAANKTQKLLGANTSGGKVLKAAPIDDQTRTRLAGQVFDSFSGPGINTDLTPKDDATSYKNVNTKLSPEETKYRQQGINSTTTNLAPGYTGT